MTHYITAEFLAHVLDIRTAQIGQIITIDDERYLITAYDHREYLYTAEKEPRHMHGHVLWRAKCSCGYSGSLGTKDRDRAAGMAWEHYVRRHLLSESETPIQALSSRYDAEPYWHD